MNLLDYKYDKYSTTGNDGIIEFIIKTIGLEKGFFVEFGAWDGIRGSNCRKLFEEEWSGLFIESRKDRFDNLYNNYSKHKQILCCNSRVGFEGKELFDNIVKPCVRNKIDFCSIDIDGLDLEVFETFNRFLPTVVCIEGGQMLHPYHERIPKSKSKHNIQQSLKVMDSVFRNKGYRLLCTYQDSFFVKQEFFHLFNVSDDLLIQYYDGLLAIPRRLPYIQMCLKKVGLKNGIINYILNNSDYSKYKYGNRKKWIKKEYNKVISIIK